MKVNEARDYDKDFPERFTWGMIDSIKLSSLASITVQWIDHDLKTTDRVLVGGLRQSLRLVAEIADI